jgi:hypothetical protein
MDAMVHRAISFANKDVRDFALEDAAAFLTNTWKLLPESNLSLRSKSFYIGEYRIALGKMLGFFEHLDADTIFHSWKGEPDPETLRAMREAARLNLETAKSYLKAKLLASGVIEALAAVSGGDAPLALFMGDLPVDGLERENLVTFLPPAATPSWIESSDPVYRLLRDGRMNESSFDLKNSPFALYLLNRLEPGRLTERMTAVEAFFSCSLSASDFLRGFEDGLLRELVKACAAMVNTRVERLSAWLEGKATEETQARSCG